MPLRRIVLYVLFATIPASILALIALSYYGNSDFFDIHPYVCGALVSACLASLVGLVMWSIAFLKVEPKLARIALWVHLICLFLFFLLVSAES